MKIQTSQYIYLFTARFISKHVSYIVETEAIKKQARGRGSFSVGYRPLQRQHIV